MTLDKGLVGKRYIVEKTQLPLQLEKRMEALGMTAGTEVELTHKKGKGTSVLVLRGTRFAVGTGVASKIVVREAVRS